MMLEDRLMRIKLRGILTRSLLGTESKVHARVLNLKDIF